MSDQIARLQSEIAALRKAAEPLAGMPELAAPILQSIVAKERELAACLAAPAIHAPQAKRDMYIATNQTINTFFGGPPGEDGERLLADYLSALESSLAMLRLSRITEERRSGSGQSLIPPLLLADVFTDATVGGDPLVLHRRTYRSTDKLDRLLRRLDRQRTVDHVEPAQVREIMLLSTVHEGTRTQRSLSPELNRGRFDPEQIPADAGLAELKIVRLRTALEAIAAHPRLVLLGAPGSGKSTVLIYLALLVVRHLRDPATQPLPPGWRAAPVPLLCPLGLVASALARKSPEKPDEQVLWEVLEAQLDGKGGVRAGLGTYLRPALRRGGALLLLDGLDEVSAAAAPGTPSLRRRVSRAIQAATRDLPRSTLVTLSCRVLPYAQMPDTPDAEWRLSPDDGWAIETIQPFAFGQVRQFVANWYHAAALCADALYTQEETTRRAESLIAQVERNDRLRRLVESPLLLTMLGLLHYNKETAELPRDRARLYDECVQLLLDRWEPVRQPDVDIQGLLERLGIQGLAAIDDLRAVMHRVALYAHDRPPAPGDGRGRLRGAEITGEMRRFLQRLRVDQIDTRLSEFEQAIHDETGLLLALGDDTFAFPHLTFQEYLAACALADDPKLPQRAYGFWASADGDRWREVLLLMAGRLRQQRKVETGGIAWLRALLSPQTPADEQNKASPPPKGREKSPVQRQRDALLAADCYREWEGRAALGTFEEDEIAQWEQRIATALLPTLGRDTQLTVEERLKAAGHLAALGDPRYPVKLGQWRDELARRGAALTNAGDHYWRSVPEGSYRIGGWEDAEEEATIALQPFWVARFPVTVAQFAPFIETGAYRADRWWTPEGRKYHQNDVQPRIWGRAGFHEPNQPVTIITWYEATAYCAWLSDQLAEALPEGYMLRLPTEAEWEVAAAYAGPGERRPYPWGPEEPTPERAISDELKLSAAAPVGCCPAGAAACGALDLAGNVWEWTNSPYREYPGAAHTAQEDFTPDDLNVPLRGGSYRSNSSSVRCGARNWNSPLGRIIDNSVRVVLAPRLAR